MIEAYVLLTLCALGYLMNKSSSEKVPKGMNTRPIINNNEIPSMRNIYESKNYEANDAKIRDKISSKYEQSKNPKMTGVINHNYNFLKDKKQEDLQEEKILSLTGDYVSKEDFTHDNMIPYYGGTIRQNMNDKSNRTLLENFTGISDMYKNKCEVSASAFNDQKKNMGNIYGTQNHGDFIQDRMVLPTIRNNEFPIPQVHVGPGLGQGFTAKPTGGFQQFETQDYAVEKCVDQLRTKRNPDPKALGISDNGKETYAGRTIDGLKTGLRGETGVLAKNRVDTFWEQTPDMLLKTTGANLKPSKVGEFNVKETNRLTTSREHKGSIYASGQLARSTEPAIKRSTRQQLKGPTIGIAAMDKYGRGNKYDYGKSRILVYNNERDVTATRVYQGNITSLVKAIVAPLEDMIKITKKQHAVNNPRHFGNMNIQFPHKGTVYDPNDVAKTTIKETTIHDAIIGNLKGSEKLTVHDPNDVARTTVKETTVHDAILGNLKGNEKLTIYDPNDVTRTTIKETTIHDAILGNLKGNEKLTIYDPNDVARTTIKETLIHDEIPTYIKGPQQLYVYDPDEIAKKTIRETVERMDYEMNMAAKVYKGRVYDPDDPTRPTMKETIVDKERLFGNIDAWARGGGYETNEHDAKLTHKQFLSDNDYYGAVGRDKGEGYITNEYNAKDTQKQFLSDIEYFGIADSTDEKKQMSYDDMYNATITERKETTLFGREPTQTGAKVFNDCINVAEPKKRECDARAERLQNNRDRIYNEISQIADDTLTKTKRTFEIEMDTRLDPLLLTAFKENPYTHPLNSAV